MPSVSQSVGSADRSRSCWQIDAISWHRRWIEGAVTGRRNRFYTVTSARHGEEEKVSGVITRRRRGLLSSFAQLVRATRIVASDDYVLGGI